MEIQIGDVFRDRVYNFKVIGIEKNWINCEVYLSSRKVAKTVENKNTLLRMKKLSSLEKELM